MRALPPFPTNEERVQHRAHVVARDRAARVRALAERVFVAAAPTLFTQVRTDEEAARFAFEVADAFERVAEERSK